MLVTNFVRYCVTVCLVRLEMLPFMVRLEDEAFFARWLFWGLLTRTSDDSVHVIRIILDEVGSFFLATVAFRLDGCKNTPTSLLPTCCSLDQCVAIWC